MALRKASIAGISVLVLLFLGVGFVFVGRPGMEPFMPHAHCYLFNEKLMLLHGSSDLIIGLSYLAISVTLGFIVFRSRRELPFHWMMLSFAVFIIACGATHFMELWTLNAANPPYWLSGWMKMLTATASLLTAVFLIPLVPRIRSVLEASRRSAEQKADIERAYAELTQLYSKAVGANPSATGESATHAGERRNLAHMAKEVSAHAVELEKAKEAAESANHAKDQFLAMLSHELRTPLMPALASASHLETAEDLDEGEIREALRSIRRNIELEARLVDDLLDLTRISKGKIQIHAGTVDLHDTIAHAIEMCGTKASEKGIEICTSLRAAEHHVTGDGARLAQVVWNILLNAIKFTPHARKIEIATSNRQRGSVEITVKDEGIGIEPEILPRIFDPFIQGDKSPNRNLGGLGLGLSIAHGLVNAHRGRITAHSEGRDKGTTFTVELATSDFSSSETNAAPSSSPLPSWKILLVEDHADTRHALERLLARWGHEVRCAATVASALEVAADFAPDLLLSDIGLPDGTGLELLVKLRRTRNFHAVAMSGFGMEADLQASLSAGFAEHLIKPITSQSLREALARAATSIRPA